MGDGREESKEGPFRELWPRQHRAHCGQIAPFCNQRLKSKFSSERLVSASFKTRCRPNQTRLRAVASPANGQHAALPAGLPADLLCRFMVLLGETEGTAEAP